MALKYVCPSCGSDIVVRYLRLGEKALCKNCGATSQVPESAIETAESRAEAERSYREPLRHTEQSTSQAPVQETAGPPTNIGRSAWNPKRFKWIGFFFTFFPAMILAAYNWERLGHPDKKRPLLIIAAAALPAWFAFIYVSGEVVPDRAMKIALGLLNWSIAAYLGSRQTPAYTEFLSKGGTKRGYGRPIVNSLLFTVGVLAIVLGVAFYEDGRRMEEFNRGVFALESGEYEKARDVFADLQGYYEDDPALWYNLGVAYINLYDYDSAARAILRGHELDSSDIDFKLLLTGLHEELGWHPENGEVTTWYVTGNRKMECSYSQGRLHGARMEYWPDGTFRRSMNFKDGVIDGQWTLWNADRSKLAEGLAVNGKLDGPVRLWDPDTQLLDTAAVYDRGVLLSGSNLEYLIE